jgi:3-oxoacyl-[acyl-carrier protein] reductase
VLVADVARKLGPVDTLVANASIGFPVKPFVDLRWMPAAMKQATANATPLARIGQPDDVAGAVLLLASDATRYVTGAYLPVCGGAVML